MGELRIQAADRPRVCETGSNSLNHQAVLRGAVAKWGPPSLGSGAVPLDYNTHAQSAPLSVVQI